MSVFCNSLVFYVSAFYFILWAVVSAGYSALLSRSYFERINDDDDEVSTGAAEPARHSYAQCCTQRWTTQLRQQHYRQRMGAENYTK